MQLHTYLNYGGNCAVAVGTVKVSTRLEPVRVERVVLHDAEAEGQHRKPSPDTCHLGPVERQNGSLDREFLSARQDGRRLRSGGHAARCHSRERPAIGPWSIKASECLARAEEQAVGPAGGEPQVERDVGM